MTTYVLPILPKTHAVVRITLEDPHPDIDPELVLKLVIDGLEAKAFELHELREAQREEWAKGPSVPYETPTEMAKRLYESQ